MLGIVRQQEGEPSKNQKSIDFIGHFEDLATLRGIEPLLPP
jgi:hypothetical protein